jgi:TetR/AcrR family transcriptional regulator, regulator of autoinduction and epiphytic fitness
MKKAVKRRTYSSPVRREQARATRRKVLSAARELFLERGYAGTAISEVARRAGVAQETVYSVFGNKRELLTQLIEFEMARGEEEIPILRRPYVDDLRAEKNQRRRLRLWVHHTFLTLERTSPVHAIIRAAAASEPKIALLKGRLQRTRFDQQKALMALMAELGPLSGGPGDASAVETFWLLASPELHHLLRVDHKWSAERYERWLADMVESLIVPKKG